MAMHHMKLKAAVAKHLEEFKSVGEASVRATLETNDHTPEEIEEIVSVLKNGGVATPTPGAAQDDKDSELERLRKENEQMKRLMSQGNKVVGDGGIKRNPNPVPKGQKEYDLYKVQQDPNSMKKPLNELNDDDFIKVGLPKKTNIRIEPYRANLSNSQSHNSGERLYEVKNK